MPRCPLCSERSAKRFCPAKGAAICAICCGTKREIEIDCPSSCPHLQAGRSFEESKPPDHERASKVRSFDDRFIQEFGPILDLLARTTSQERHQSPWLVDNDAVEVLKALEKTMKTLESGLYYESAPEGSGRAGLFRSLRAVLDSVMSPETEGMPRVIKVSEVLRMLDFMLWSASIHSNGRPKCRRFLDWLSEAADVPPPAPAASRLILS